MKDTWIRKKVMRGRSSSFFGRRAFVTVRFPFSLFSDVPPIFDHTPYGEPGTFKGWFTKYTDTHVITTAFSQVSSGTDPRTFTDIDQAPPYCVTEAHGVYNWWEAQQTIWRKDQLDDKEYPKPDEKPEHAPLTEDQVREYVAREDWIDKHLYQGVDADGVVNDLVDLGNYARTTYPALDHAKREAEITYAIKYFYPDRLRNFVYALRRVMRKVKHQNLPVRIV